MGEKEKATLALSRCFSPVGALFLPGWRGAGWPKLDGAGAGAAAGGGTLLETHAAALWTGRRVGVRERPSTAVRPRVIS